MECNRCERGRGQQLGKKSLEQNWLVNHIGVEATMARLKKNDVAVTRQTIRTT